jgi:hypothetical protein
VYVRTEVRFTQVGGTQSASGCYRRRWPMSAMEGEIGGGESQIRSGGDGEELSSEMSSFVGFH